MRPWLIAMATTLCCCATDPQLGDTDVVTSDVRPISDADETSDAIGCDPADTGGPDAPAPIPEGAYLTSNELWTLTAPEDDPWFAARDMNKVPCSSADLVVEESAGPEEAWLSVRTQNCGYVTVSQPLLHDVEACTALLVHIWYFKFLAPKDVDGVGFELVVTVGDDVQAPLFAWSGDQLPPESGLVYEVVQTPRRLLAGEMVHYHVSNHGSNSWEFIQLRSFAPDAVPAL